jgi:HKD family nuclease
MAYTIRTTDQDEKNIKKLMAFCGANSVSKALLKSAKEWEAKHDDYVELLDWYNKVKEENRAMKEAYKAQEDAKMKLKILMK